MELFVLFTASYIIAIRYTSALKEELDYYETLTLSDFNRRVRRSAGVRPESFMHEVQFSALGRDFHMLLKEHAPVTHDFKATSINGKGETEHIQLDLSQFFSGRLKDEERSKVDVHWEEGLMIASIVTEDDMYFVEPSWRHTLDIDNQSMIAYRKSDLKWHPTLYTEGTKGSFCGVNNSGTAINEETQLDDGLRLYPMYDDTYGTSHSRHKRQTMSVVGSHTVCKLIAVADKYFFDNIGRGSQKLAGEYLIGMIARVNSIYKETRWPSDSSGLKDLGFEIFELKVHTGYTEGSDHYNQPSRTNDMGKVLDMFGWDWPTLKRACLAHLFTYQSFPGKLGLAYIASPRYTDLGGMCSPVAWKSGRRMAANTGVSSYRNPGGSQALTLQATITTAHELGHNWGSEHDPDTTDCAPDSSSGGRYIMYPTAINGYQRNNDEFSPCSRRYIYKVIEKKGFDCFKEKTSGGTGLCGNGRLDKGEQCDAGYEGDRCCSTDCRFKNPAFKCTPMNYACCQDCRVAPVTQVCIEDISDNLDCTQESRCDGVNLNCPQPSPVPDDTECHDGGRCKGGICLDYCALFNREPCLCTGDDACKRCCRIRSPPSLNLTYPCRAMDDNESLQDGRPCVDGFCDKGKCEKVSGSLIKRLYKIIEYFSVDNIAIIMKNNIVWLVFYLTIPVWVIAMIIINCRDKQIEKEGVESIPLTENVMENQPGRIRSIGVRTPRSLADPRRAHNML